MIFSSKLWCACAPTRDLGQLMAVAFIKSTRKICLCLLAPSARSMYLVLGTWHLACICVISCVSCGIVNNRCSVEVLLRTSRGCGARCSRGYGGFPFDQTIRQAVAQSIRFCASPTLSRTNNTPSREHVPLLYGTDSGVVKPLRIDRALRTSTPSMRSSLLKLANRKCTRAPLSRTSPTCWRESTSLFSPTARQVCLVVNTAST